MADTYKVLGQANPLAATLTSLYAVPGVTQAIVSTVTVANRSNVATSFRLSVAIAAAADANQQYIAYDVPIGGNEAIALTLGIALQASDVIRCYATLATLSFNAFGVEKT